MNRPIEIIQPNKVTKLYDQLNRIFYLFGLKNYWISELGISDRFLSFYRRIYEPINNVLNIYFPISILGSFLTQKNLSEQQAAERLKYGVMFPCHWVFYLILLFYKAQVRELLYCLAVVLREHYNDPELEVELVKKIKMYNITLTSLVVVECICSGLKALFGMITAGENFITCITVWPDVNDTSIPAGVMRVIIYVCWYTFTTRILTTFCLLITMMLSVCYQFKNLQSYFYHLDDIFEDQSLSQAEKERKYEESFKLGIQMHTLSLWCKKQHQRICYGIFTWEIIIFFCMFMVQLTTLLRSHNNSTTELVTTAMRSMTTLLALGFFMCSGGDITVEAHKLSEAIYSSGWQNCYGQSAVRIRKLVVGALRQAQEPVLYKTLGVVEFSYEAYVSIVKMPYTALSVLY